MRARPGEPPVRMGRMDLSGSASLDYLRSYSISLLGRGMRSKLVLVSAVVIIAAALVACSGSAAPTIEGAWARPAAAGAETAAYLTIKGAAGQADSLMSASSPDAATVEVHEATTDAQGMMGMHPIDHLDIHAGESVELKPGGFHIMVMGLTRELAVGGDPLQIELVFENAGKIVVQAEIRQG
jgi:copper(I)-binding protein